MERPSLKRIFCGTGLVLLTLLTLLSVASHSHDDPPNPNYPPSGEVKNMCGIVGAYLSGILFTYLGPYTSCLLVVLGMLWVGLFFSRREFKDPWLKGLGVFCLILIFSAYFGWRWRQADPDGSATLWGGVLGEAIAGFLIRYFSYPGSLILILTLGMLSLLLATDMLVWNGLGWLFEHVPLWFRAVVTFLRERTGREAVVVGEGAGGQVAVRSRRSRKKPKDDSSDEKGQAASSGEEQETPAPEAEPEAVEPRRAAIELPEELPEEPRFVAGDAPDREFDGEREPFEIPDIEEDRAASDAEEHYELPGMDLLDDATDADTSRHDAIIQEKARVLERCLKEFGISVRVVGIDTGPVVTLYELELAPGIKVGRIIGLSDDMAMALKAPNVRIVAPIPGKSTVGVEVPNIDKEYVRLIEVMEGASSAASRQAIPLYLGKDAAGAPLACDMASMPHLLIAGETGSGKSVCINSVILSILLTRTPHQVRLLLVDPKMVELSQFNNIPHLLSPVVTDMKKAAGILEWAESKMDERYTYLALANVRNIAAFNRLGEEELRKRYGLEPNEEVDPTRFPMHLPYIIIIVDELADLMMLAAKEVETSITRLAQKSRAVGIHIILATQRPSVNVITGLIKSNLPARISFRVPSKVDSRTILDQNGAEKLLGSGDMLFLQPGTSKLIRAQGTFVSDDEVHRLVEFVKEQSKPDFSRELVQLQRVGEGGDGSRDPLYDEAVRVVLESQRGSVSLLQRRLEIGYSRAARLVDFMAEDGIVGTYKGSQAREVLYTLEEWEQMRGKHDEEEE